MYRLGVFLQSFYTEYAQRGGQSLVPIPPHPYGVFTPEQDNDKTNVELVDSYYAFHTRSDKPGVTGIIGIHRFNMCLVVVLLWCENTITPVVIPMFLIGSERQIQSQYQI